MPVSVKDLLKMSSLGLELVAGSGGADRPIRWVHTSELPDPTPWLTGGELLLTTGMAIQGAEATQAAYLERLVDAGLAGLGFGIGFGFDEVPKEILRIGDEHDFPVLEVPYAIPFIAISEAVSSQLGEDRLRDAQMSVEVHERLTSMVTFGAGPGDVVEEVVQLAPGWAFLFDARGHVTARAESLGLDPPDPQAVWGALPQGLAASGGPSTAGQSGPGGMSVALSVSAGGRRPEGVFVYGKQSRIDQRDRIVVHHAVTVLGLLLASRRAVIEAERRVAGDVLSEAFAGRLSGEELGRRLELVGFDREDPLTVLVIEPNLEPGAELDDLAWAVDAAAGARSQAARVGISKGKVTALVSHAAPVDLAETVAVEIGQASDGTGSLSNGAVRIGVGETVGADRIRDSYISALFALRAAPEVKRVASPRDLGSYGFLLGAQPRGMLEGFVRSVLGPLIDRDKTKASQLVESVRSFIEAGGRWEQGAEILGIHRHTLRYRVRQAEELLDRDLTHAEDRLEVWLALKAAEILNE